MLKLRLNYIIQTLVTLYICKKEANEPKIGLVTKNHYSVVKLTLTCK